MDPQLLDRKIGCPFCGEAMEIVLDLSAGGQSYIEDCQVCCQPMQVSFAVEDGELTSIRVERAG
ncbi:MAG TPA: CPXCG motif-containing cysteine-rich protein [Woeseiaceae bacterium]|nr:CPXCG motif-containing cysteine-rich protein [Woeseiaceae bacterium]